MSKNRPNQPPLDRHMSDSSRGRTGRRPAQLSFPLRAVLSLFFVWHVTAVFMAPLSIPPSSPLVVDTAQATFMQKYLDVLYLNHGYHFFAPDPGAGHLIEYELYDDQGRKIKEGEFPNKKENWPRLLYHRYFMLADQCEVATRDEAEAARWRQTYLTAYARQLLRQNDGASVRVQRVVHYPLPLPDALQGKSLTDASLYERQQPIVVQRRQELDLPPPSQTGARNNWQQDVARGWQGGVR